MATGTERFTDAQTARRAARGGSNNPFCPGSIQLHGELLSIIDDQYGAGCNTRADRVEDKFTRRLQARENDDRLRSQQVGIAKAHAAQPVCSVIKDYLPGAIGNLIKILIIEEDQPRSLDRALRGLIARRGYARAVE